MVSYLRQHVPLIQSLTDRHTAYIIPYDKGVFKIFKLLDNLP